MTVESVPTPDRLMQSAWGYAPTLIIEAAVHYRLFDLLDRGPRSCDELVRETGASRRGIGAILDALVGLKLLARSGDRYALTTEIQEFMPDDDRQGPPHPLIFAVNMLVNTEAGSTYTFAEIRSWLEEAGFVNARLLPVPAVSPVVLADRSRS